MNRLRGEAFGRTALASFDIEYDGNALYKQKLRLFRSGRVSRMQPRSDVLHWCCQCEREHIRRKCCPEQQGPIPEPATWVMMITGFGVIGAAMRRRNYRASCLIELTPILEGG